MSHAVLQRKSRSGVVRASSHSESSVLKSSGESQPNGAGRGVVSAFSLSGVQRHIKVGSSSDPAEHEANRVADHVASGSSKSPPPISRLMHVQRQTASVGSLSASGSSDVQRKESTATGEQSSEHVQRSISEEAKSDSVQRSSPSAEAMDRRPSGTASVQCMSHDPASSDVPVQRKSVADNSIDREATAGLDAAAARAISTKDSGGPLRPNVMQKLESRIGADFSGVRVHEGPAAHESAAALNARAFTHENDIWLGRGESQDNLHLMAHEATHIVQQGAAPQSAASATPSVAAADPEHAASESASATGATAAASPANQKPSKSTPASASAEAAGASTKAVTSPSSAKGSGERSAAESHNAEAAKGPEAAGGAPAAEQKRAARSPQSDPAFQSVVKHVKAAAKQQKTHAPASSKASAAHAAAASPTNEVSSRASAKQTDEMNRQQPKPFNRAAFKAALLKKIEATAPKTLEAADDFKENNNLASVKSDLNSQVKEDKKESQGPLEEKVVQTPDTSGIEPKPVTPLPAEAAGAVPQIPAAGAAPKPVNDEDISLKSGPQELNQQMAQSQVTEQQLQQSNEPEFQSALSQKKDVEKQAVAAPQAFRAQEPALLHAAQNDAQGTATKDASGMHDAQKHSAAGVTTHQTDAKAEEEKQTAKIFGDIENIYNSTKKSVEDRLARLDTEVNKAFDAGAVDAQKAFEDYVDLRMSRYKEKRYGGWGGGALWLKDKLFDLPDEVNVFYQEGHDLYVSKMDGVIDQIAAMVESGLNEAKAIVAMGKAAIQTYLAGLSPALQATGKKAAAGIQDKFDALEQSVDEKQNELIDSLAKKYNENMQKVDARIAEMKEANKGLVSKVAGAIKSIIETIKHLKDMLLNVLSRAASAISKIIAHPIRFLGHLIDAGKLGFDNFRKKILVYLKEGFMQWLFGAVAKAGIQLPQTFDLAGILSLVLQVLGLTYANIRARAVAILGEKVVKALETAAEIFKVLMTKGVSGLWDYIKDKLGNLIDTVIDKIKSFIMEKVIIAGVTWLIGLLNPASAFVKACKAIYDIVMFFVEHGSEILDLVNAVIDSMTAIADGKIDQAAAWIEKSLARAIPVIIGFLASLLGVGGISEKIKEVIDSIRKPINEAIDWVIHKAVDLVKAVGGLLGVGNKPDERTPEQKAKDLDSALSDSEQLAGKPGATPESVTGGLDPIKKKYRLNQLELDPEGGDKYEILGSVNPSKKKPVKLKNAVLPSVIGFGGLDPVRGGTSMTASPLSHIHPVGTSPGVEPPIWNSVNQRRNGKRLYVLGHLLNQQLGGSGDDLRNLTPITFSANGTHLARVERDLKKMVNEENRMVHYEVKVNYPSSRHPVPKSFKPPDGHPAEGDLATSLSASWWELEVDKNNPTKTVMKGGVNTIQPIQNVPPFPPKD